MQPRLNSNSLQSSCLSLLSARATGMSYMLNFIQEFKTKAATHILLSGSADLSFKFAVYEGDGRSLAHDSRAEVRPLFFGNKGSRPSGSIRSKSAKTLSP